MLRTQHGTRLLGPNDLPSVLELLSLDPVVNVFVDYRARLTRLDPRWLGGEMWGYSEGGELVSVCHAAANLVPAMATPDAVEGFARRALRRPRRCSTIVGPADAVEPLWERLEPHWERPRERRPSQPHLEISTAPSITADPLVRRTEQSDFDALYPACVAMYTEEVGVSPEDAGGGDLYRARVSQLISKGWSFARIESGRVLFKAEVAAVSPYACQIQGVYVDPALRGQGIGTAGMATVVDVALREIAPVVSLYVNDHNLAAQRVYERVGFAQTATLSTVMF